MAGEAARGVDAVADAADDRVRVRPSCRRGPPTRRRSSRRPPAGKRRARRSSRSAKTESSTVVSKPQRGSASFIASTRPLAAAAEVEARLALDHERQPLPARRPARSASSCRQSGRTGSSTPSCAPSAADHGPHAITTVSACGASWAAPVFGRTSTPSSAARRTSSRATAGRIGGAVLRRRTPRRARRPSRAPCTNARVDPLDRDAELLLQRDPLLQRGEPALRSSRGRGSRPGRRTARRAPRRTRCSRARAPPRPRSRTAAARRPSPARSSRPRSRRGRTARRRARRASARWYAMLAPIAPAPATRITAARAPRARRRRATAAARARRRGSARPSSPRRPSRAPWNGKRSSARAQPLGLGGALRRRLVHERGDHLRIGGGQPRHRARRAGREPARDERLGADEDVEPVEQVRLDRLPRLVGDLEPAQVRRPSRAAARPPRPAPRSRSARRTRRRRTAAARTRPRPRRSAPRAPRSSSVKNGGAITATAAAPASAACAASAAVSAVDCAPQCTATGTRPPRGARRRARPRAAARRARAAAPRPSCRARARRRSPPATRKSTYGANAASSSAAPPSRSGVSAAANAPEITVRSIRSAAP